MLSSEEFLTALSAEMPRLRRLAQRTAPKGIDADDLVQDTLERAWRAQGTYRGDASLATWLHRILINRSKDLAGRNAPLTVPANEDLRAMTVPDPLAVIEQAEDEQHLRAGLAQLPVQDRMMLVLHDSLDWSAAEIADLGGFSEAAAHKRLQRARLRMVQILAKTSGTIERQTADCRQARDSLAPYLEGTLADETQRHIEAHLRHCPHCPPLAQALVGLRSALSHPSPKSTPAPRLMKALASFRQEVDEYDRTSER